MARKTSFYYSFLVLPAEQRRVASRPELRPWWRWRNLDLGVALLALPLLAESRLRGSVQIGDTAADDPLGILFPALALGLLAS